MLNKISQKSSLLVSQRHYHTLGRRLALSSQFGVNNQLGIQNASLMHQNLNLNPSFGQQAFLSSQAASNTQFYAHMARRFASKNDDDIPETAIKPRRKRRTKEEILLAKQEKERVKEEKRLAKEQAKLEKQMAKKQKVSNAVLTEEDQLAQPHQEISSESTEGSKLKEIKMYTLKFNTPILPFVKFPLSHNNYINDFLKMYESEKDHIDRIIGVHFKDNKNQNCKDQVGIEITITKKNNMTVVESNSNKRFKVKSYDSDTNYCMAEEYNDELMQKEPFQCSKKGEINPKYRDLLMSELFELKNLWFTSSKKINSVLVILPQEILNKYDVVAKSLQYPVFDLKKYGDDTPIEDVFNQIAYKMASYYFQVFQTIFSKDNESVRRQIQEFLTFQDPIMRSRKIISYFEELHDIIDKKLYYVQKMADEFKERSKTSLLEHAFQKVLEDTKKSEKEKYQQKLDEVANIPESIRKTLQEEIDQLDTKNDTENSRKIQYLNQVFRLPWDKKVEPFWDVEYSSAVLDKSHYGMVESKERILEFIAKNKRVNSQKGMVLLLTGPPGVGKTSIAKSIGECLKRPTTVISMGGQNDPIHIKGSKRTYVDSQPGIFIKELQRLECKNPVVVIDEIDKVGSNSLKGDISSTLLELLNPEQANQFRDNYLDLDFDFTEVIFICTSNSTANMLGPLLDRIEIIQVPAYLPIERLNIAKQYLIPAFEDEYGFIKHDFSSETQQTAASISSIDSTEESSTSENTDGSEKINESVIITDAAISQMIKSYCGYEAGVRNLRKCIDRVFRKIVAKLEMHRIQELKKVQPLNSQECQNADEAAGIGYHAEDAELHHKDEQVKDNEIEYQVNTQNLEVFLDIPATDDNYFNDINKIKPPGCSNGLAYIDNGYGTVMKIQFVKKVYGQHIVESGSEESEGKRQGSLSFTGRLGDVMKESVEVVKIAVFNFLQKKGISKDFDKDSYHLHVPMGATPKDGPSAGISLFAALVSIAINKPVSPNIAMTGEITTLGEVISIGGVREKLTACKNHNVSRVILPLSNKKHVKKLPKEFKKGFTIFYVQNISQVYNICFESDEADCDYSMLKEQGVEIEQYEEDTFNKKVIEGETISDKNGLDKIC